ncbi:IclR family transcriptional regulator [Halorarum halobium]|uniref:IclR family transcriptional regulator n=1 Tax=Halorarum halobium TaxID=3075121 RepID=UPI0028A6CDB4|nr:IclR family transcriptional regulator [Halobaculum sp. XH14]
MSSGGSSDSPRRIKSLQNASEILEKIQYLQAPTFARLCEELELSKGTIHTYVETLHEEGFVGKSGNQYSLGFRCLTMGETVRNQSDLYQAGQERVRNLADETDEWVHLTAPFRGQEVTVYESSGDQAIGTDYHLQTRESPQYLHHTATGKAMLAAFDRERVEEIIDRWGLVRKTPATITDAERLFSELDRISDQGYAVNDEEEVRGIRSVGTWIQGRDDSVRGGISVTAPSSRFSGEYFNSTVPSMVKEAANIIEVNLEIADADAP